MVAHIYLPPAAPEHPSRQSALFVPHKAACHAGCFPRTEAGRFRSSTALRAVPDRPLPEQKVSLCVRSSQAPHTLPRPSGRALRCSSSSALASSSHNAAFCSLRQDPGAAPRRRDLPPPAPAPSASHSPSSQSRHGSCYDLSARSSHIGAASTPAPVSPSAPSVAAIRPPSIIERQLKRHGIDRIEKGSANEFKKTT